MAGYSLAVFSDSSEYINRFLAYCRNNRTIFNVSGFTDPEVLFSYLEETGTDILLLSRSNALVNISGWVNDGNEQDRMPGRITPGRVSETVYLGEHQDLSASPKELCIYQPMRSLLAELEHIAAGLGRKETVTSRIDIQGIYVLDGSPDINSFIMQLAESREHGSSRILYIDLDRFSGMEAQYGIDPLSSLSDLIYSYIADPERLERLLGSTASSGNIHYICASASPSDTDEIADTGWKAFVSTLAETGRYDTVVINISGSCRDIAAIFGICRKIYLFSGEYRNISQGAESISNIRAEAHGGHLSFRAAAFLKYLNENGSGDISLRFVDGYGAGRELLQNSQAPSTGKRTLRANGRKRTD